MLSTRVLIVPNSWNIVPPAPLLMVSLRSKSRNWKRINSISSLRMSTATSNVFLRRWTCSVTTNFWLTMLSINYTMAPRIWTILSFVGIWITALMSSKVNLTSANLPLMYWSASRQETPKILNIWKIVLWHMIMNIHTITHTTMTMIMHTTIKSKSSGKCLFERCEWLFSKFLKFCSNVQINVLFQVKRRLILFNYSIEDGAHNRSKNLFHIIFL